MNDPTDILVEVDGAVVTVTINRPDNGNMLRVQTLRELHGALCDFRDDPGQRVMILTGAGDRFFCIGGEHDELEDLNASSALPILDVYDLIDRIPKPIIAAVNGYAVGGGNVLQVVCDITLAADNAVFRQVGPMVGSFDSGYGTWYLEDVIGRKRAKEMWYFNRKYTAQQALEIGLVNAVVPSDELAGHASKWAAELLERGPGALAGIKAAFSARHTGVAGQARMAHDLLLTRYLDSEEAKELSRSFAERRSPDQSKFGR